jgi:UDP-N-acetylglucosamine--N-acetylmuramyl-(pentapeptide) pyrophosphoryl-undecaprenol N-acetylglucosamine transferase
MKIWLVGGGTAGHILPLLTLASELEHRGVSTNKDILILTNRSRLANNIFSNSNFTCSQIVAGKFRRYHGRTWFQRLIDAKTLALNVIDIFKVIIGFGQSFYKLLINRPDIIFFKGGYVGIPIWMACKVLRVGYLIHESDSILGLANRLMAPGAINIALGMPSSNVQKRFDNVTVTGIPIASAFFEPPGSEHSVLNKLGLDHSVPIILVLGGSLGAKNLNSALISQAAELCQEASVIHVTGKANFKVLEQALDCFNEQVRTRYKLIDYIDSGMPAIMAVADIVISRAGATTIAELAAMRKPTILVPNPWLSGGHQLHNADWLSQQKAVIVVQESRQMPLELFRSITNLLHDSGTQKADLAKTLNRLFDSTQATNQIADLIIASAGVKM